MAATAVINHLSSALLRWKLLRKTTLLHGGCFTPFHGAHIARSVSQRCRLPRSACAPRREAASERSDASAAGLLAAFQRLFEASLDGDGALLSTHPAAVGARFRLLSLCLRFCRRCAVGPSPPAAAAAAVPGLRRRLLVAGLAWFRQPAAYYASVTRSQAEENCRAVADFLRLLSGEKGWSEDGQARCEYTHFVRPLDQAFTALWLPCCYSSESFVRIVG